jgi:hypothetical protein
MKFEFDFRAPRIDKGAFIKELDRILISEIKKAARAWLEATVIPLIPVWSGASRGTFLKLAESIEFGIPIQPTAPPGRGVGIAGGRAASDGGIEIRAGLYLFHYSTTLAHLIINEFNDATQWGFNLRNPGPYHFQEAGRITFEGIKAMLPSPFKSLKFDAIKV